MHSVIKNTILTLTIFCIVPAVFIAINWQWEPEILNSTSRYLFWITQTSGVPWAFVSSTLLVIIFILCLKNKSKKNVVKCCIIILLAMLLGQISKFALKTYTAESRPFVRWIEKTYQIDDEFFYSLPPSERSDIIEQHIASSSHIPNWLYQHWQYETGYSFPSGHTLFATLWVFLALVLLNIKRYNVLVYIITAWAVLVQISRIVLGMHYPIDVMVGSFLAWIIALLAYYLSFRWQVNEQ